MGRNTKCPAWKAVASETRVTRDAVSGEDWRECLPGGQYNSENANDGCCTAFQADVYAIHIPDISCPVTNLRSTAFQAGQSIWRIAEASDVTCDVTNHVTYKVSNDIVLQLTERQKAILSFVKVNPYVIAPEMSRSLRVSIRTIRRDIEKMAFLHHIGDKNDGFWTIASKEAK